MTDKQKLSTLKWFWLVCQKWGKSKTKKLLIERLLVWYDNVVWGQGAEFLARKSSEE